MAKLLEIKENNAAKKNVIKTLFLLLALCAIVFGSLVYYRSEETMADSEEAKAVVGVHIKGAVKNSGYYEVPYGTRVRDLADIAGGCDENADMDGVNLAAYVEDGEEIYFPYKGSAENGGINLNTADADELTSLDGIGDTTAQKIIDYREAHGGFQSVIELKDILGNSKYESVREKLYVE